ncbi:hypothetical protein LCGC14_3081640 [marine sediment metagenome]|uniref:Uncharacterized protein n=1 Tax=marine sediment metagenome TaxID=412755 RepID=A0A0F8Z3S3_9ZZZZ
MNTMFTDKDWQVIGAANMNELYYARHDCRPGDRSWMCYWQRNCADCDERVPDSIQTVLRLLVATGIESDRV